MYSRCKSCTLFFNLLQYKEQCSNQTGLKINLHKKEIMVNPHEDTQIKNKGLKVETINVYLGQKITTNKQMMMKAEINRRKSL